MIAGKTERGFRFIEHPDYPTGEPVRLLQESGISDDEESFGCPGGSFLWIGCEHHLNREEVQEMIDHMQYWLEHKRLSPEE